MRDPNFKIDKAYTDKAWKEMEGVLNQHLPVKPPFLKKRYNLLLLLFFLLGGSTAIYLTYQAGGDGNHNDTVSQLEDVVVSEAVPQSEIAQREQLKQDIIQKEESAVNHSPIIQSTESKSVNTEHINLSETDKNAEGSQTTDNSIISSQRTQKEENLLLGSKSEKKTLQDIQPVQVLEPMMMDNLNLRMLRHVSYQYPFIPTLFPKILAGNDWIASASGLLWIDKNGNQITPVSKVKKPLDGLGIQLSARLLDGFRPNAELGLNWGLSVSPRWRVRPGIGLGFDNYQWSSPAYEASLRTHFVSSFSSIAFTERERKGYMVVSMDILYAIHNRVFIAAGGGRRMYNTGLFESEALSGSPSMNPNEMDFGNVSSERLYIQPSSAINYFQAGVSYKLNASLYLTTSYLLQLNSGIKDTRLGNVPNADINPGKRQEWRIGINYDF